MASGVQDCGGERKRAGPVTLEPVWASRKRHPRKASPKEEEEVSRGQREIRSREPERPSEHALWEVVGRSAHAALPQCACAPRSGSEGGSGDFRFESCLLSGFGGTRWGGTAGRSFSGQG